MCCVLSLLLVYVTAELPVNAKAQPAQAWPTRPIKLIVPTGARTATDIMARLVASAIDESLGQPVVVENMPGASGILAHRAIARLSDRAEDLLHRVEIDAASSAPAWRGFRTAKWEGANSGSAGNILCYARTCI